VCWKSFTIFALPSSAELQLSFSDVRAGIFSSFVHLNFIEPIVLFYLFTLANSQTQWKFGGAANGKCDKLNPTSNHSLVFAQTQIIEHLPVRTNWTFHAQPSAHMDWTSLKTHQWIHRCRSRQLLEGAKHILTEFSQTFPKTFLRQIFPYKFVLQLVANYHLSRIAKHDVFLWRSKKLFFWEKKVNQTFLFVWSVRFIENLIGNKRVSSSVSEFTGISPKFSTKNFGGALDPSDPTQLNGQRDIIFGKSLQNMESATLSLEKSCKNSKTLKFPCWVHWSFPLHHLSIGWFRLQMTVWNISCLLHLWEINNSNLT